MVHVAVRCTLKRAVIDMKTQRSIGVSGSGLSQACVPGLLFGARGHQKSRLGGHLELQQGCGAPMFRYGAQRAGHKRPRCVGAGRAQTQMLIYLSIGVSAVRMAFKLRCLTAFILLQAKF